MSYPRFRPGDEAIVKGSFEVVRVNVQFADNVLVTRAGGQFAMSAHRLEPYCSGSCPLQPQGD